MLQIGFFVTGKEHTNRLHRAALQNKNSPFNYLGRGAGLAAGSDQVGGVGQVNEQFLLRLQSWSRKIQQKNLEREIRGMKNRIS